MIETDSRTCGDCEHCATDMDEKPCDTCRKLSEFKELNNQKKGDLP